MSRTMIYLPDGFHRALKHLAIERKTSFAKLVQEALETLYREDIEDIQVGHERLENCLVHPERVTSYPAYRRKRLER